jgi:hypothetical protein
LPPKRTMVKRRIRATSPDKKRRKQNSDDDYEPVKPSKKQVEYEFSEVEEEEKELIFDNGGRVLINNTLVAFKKMQSINDQDAIKMLMVEPIEFHINSNIPSWRYITFKRSEIAQLFIIKSGKHLKGFAFKPKGILQQITDPETYNRNAIETKSHGYIIFTTEKKYIKQFSTVLNHFMKKNKFFADANINETPHFIDALIDDIQTVKLDSSLLKHVYLDIAHIPPAELVQNKYTQTTTKARPSAKPSAKTQLNLSTSSIVSNSSQLDEDSWLFPNNHKAQSPISKSARTPSPRRKLPTIRDDLTPSKVLLEYKKIRLIQRDLDRCEEGEFLNDNIIDFAIQHFMDNHPNANVYIFPTTFFPLLEKDLDRAVKIPSVKSVNLFEKDLVFIPINKGLHWVLIVVCFPGDAERRNLMYCDSLSSTSDSQVIKSIAKYMQARHKVELPNSTEKKIKFRTSIATLPKQSNSCDCGIFTIHYIEQIVKRFPTEFPIQDPEWFDKKEISEKRQYLKSTILKLASEYKSMSHHDDNDEKVKK